MSCIGKFPYFAFQKVSRKKTVKTPDESLGKGARPNAPLWLVRSVPKSLREAKKLAKKSGNVLVGYYLKRVVQTYRSPNRESVLFVKGATGFKRFMARYGITVGFVDWDKVAEEWGGVEFGQPFLPGWSDYEVAIWSPLAIKDINVCKENTKKPIFVTYTLSYCPYSQDVLDKLEKLRIPHLNYVVADEEKDKLKAEHNWPTFPHVFVIGSDGEKYFLGGSDQFDEFLKGLAE